MFVLHSLCVTVFFERLLFSPGKSFDGCVHPWLIVPGGGPFRWHEVGHHFLDFFGEGGPHLLDWGVTVLAVMESDVKCCNMFTYSFHVCFFPQVDFPFCRLAVRGADLSDHQNCCVISHTWEGFTPLDERWSVS